MSKIKTGIKMRVNPEQSKKVQEICIGNGIGWISKREIVQYINEPYLFIDDIISFMYKDQEEFFVKEKNEEVSAELFIRTNGTCVESEAPTKYMVFVKGKNTPRYTHETKDSAETEAKRLSTKMIGLKVSVVEIVSEFKSKVVVEEVK